jgi:hypothetical protein
MKKAFLAMALTVSLLMPIGCVKATSTTPAAALAPGYLNQADQVMGQSLVGAHAFYMTIQRDVASGKYTPSPTEKTTLNNFATALNTAQVIYVGYHAGVNTESQAQAAVNAVTSQQTAVQSSLTTGGK